MSTRSRIMARALFLARECGLSDVERRELAMMLPGQRDASDSVSWALLDADDLLVMVHWLTGYRNVRDLKRLR